MTIYGYARVSTVTQVKEGESLDTQKLQIQSYAISKGLELDAANILVEAGVSGGIEFANRPEGSKLTQLVTTGDIIIFPKLDRAFRNTRNALNLSLIHI
jgi:putative DNA-invertase from lambdoid prophage Rac